MGNGCLAAALGIGNSLTAARLSQSRAMPRVIVCQAREAPTGNAVDLSSPSDPVSVGARLLGYNGNPRNAPLRPGFCSPSASKNRGGVRE